MSDAGGRDPLPGPFVQPQHTHVFTIAATVLPIPRTAAPTVDREADVALLVVPRAGEDFSIRVPRGTIRAGALFALRRVELGHPHVELVRALAVDEPTGLRFDIVTARIESSEAGTKSGAPPRPAADEPRTPRLRATANAVSAPGVRTIDGEVRVSLLSAVAVGTTLELGVHRGKIPAGAYFALRYSDDVGAKVALARASSSRPAPGMSDTVRADVLAPPEPVPERQSYRAAVDVYFTAVLATQGDQHVMCRLVDLSAEGAGFQASVPLEAGDRIVVHDRTLAYLDGVELVVVRRDTQEPGRYGALFAEPNRGAAIISALLELDDHQREQRHGAHTSAFRTSGSGTARPVSRDDIDRRGTQGIRTRSS